METEVGLKTAAAVASTRSRRIEALEKQLVLGLGDKQAVITRLTAELEAQWA